MFALISMNAPIIIISAIHLVIAEIPMEVTRAIVSLVMKVMVLSVLISMSVGMVARTVWKTSRA